MNRIETVKAVLNHSPCKRLPKGELFINREYLDRYFKNGKDDYIEQLKSACQSLGLDVIGIDMNEDSFFPSLSRNEYKKLDAFFTVGCLEGPFSLVTRLKSFEEAMLDLKMHRSTYSMVISMLLQRLYDVMPFVKKNSFMAIAILDDIAGRQGLMMSPSDFEDVLYPFYQSAVKIVKEHGLYAFFHSDGNICDILEHIMDAGFDCFHCVDAQAGMDLNKLSEECGENIAFMGHVDILAWNENRIDLEIERAEKKFCGGGLILGSSCGISKEVPINNLRTLYPTWGSTEELHK
jgi:uroporphyrinogen-III decarboxylase